MCDATALGYASSNLWHDESPDNCRLCFDGQPSVAIPLPVCARCAWHIYNVIALALGESPRELPGPPSSDRDDVVGLVYYIRRGDIIKIGFTTNLRQRMAALLPDEILAVEPGSFALEAERHRQFAHLRRGRVELFDTADDLLEHIARVVAEHGPAPTVLLPV